MNEMNCQQRITEPTDEQVLSECLKILNCPTEIELGNYEALFRAGLRLGVFYYFKRIAELEIEVERHKDAMSFTEAKALDNAAELSVENTALKHHNAKLVDELNSIASLNWDDVVNILTNVCQLMDAWKTDSSWSPHDTELRHQVSHLLSRCVAHSSNPMPKALTPSNIDEVKKEKDLESEQGRWQQAIYDLLIKHCPDATIDGKGCDSGDPLDFSLSEIGQAICLLKDLSEERRKMLERVYNQNGALTWHEWDKLCSLARREGGA